MEWALKNSSMDMELSKKFGVKGADELEWWLMDRDYCLEYDGKYR